MECLKLLPSSRAGCGNDSRPATHSLSQPKTTCPGCGGSELTLPASAAGSSSHAVAEFPAVALPSFPGMS